MIQKFIPPPKKGFTLVETLIIFLIVGIVATVIIASVSYLFQFKIRESQTNV